MSRKERLAKQNAEKKKKIAAEEMKKINIYSSHRYLMKLYLKFT